MSETLAVTEIIRRLEQGTTQPFLVRAEDGALYVAKGREATRRGQMAEWICAHLARGLGLELPDFALLEVAEELARAFGQEGRALGAGPVFGSRLESGVQEFWLPQLKSVSAETRLSLLAFDWWVENSDRSLTLHGGNPNLLWQASRTRLLVIDHNLAFDPDFDEAAFLAVHVFKEDADDLFGDLVRRLETADRLSAALSEFDAALRNLPDDWWWLDVEQTLPTQVDLAVIRTRLAERAGLLRGSQP